MSIPKLCISTIDRHRFALLHQPAAFGREMAEEPVADADNDRTKTWAVNDAVGFNLTSVLEDPRVREDAFNYYTVDLLAGH